MLSISVSVAKTVGEGRGWKAEYIIEAATDEEAMAQGIERFLTANPGANQDDYMVHASV